MSRALPTSQHTIGPFFPRTYFGPTDNDLRRRRADAAPSARGEAIRIAGQVTRADGAVCVNALLEAWQADAGGRFDHPADPDAAAADPDFLGWGRAATDAEGRYHFLTLLPGGFAEGNQRRAPHVNLQIMASGLMRPVLTTLFFPQFAAENAADPVLALVPEGRRGLLLARPEGSTEGFICFRFDIRLRGSAAEETPFFVE
jgi:protocatechuate 3,4-dioxygenase alpha subunit